MTNLRALATVLVIALHVCADYLADFQQEAWQWESMNLLDSATRICIGLFFMITGALLINKNIDLKAFLKTRFTRILFPFLFWTGVYVAFVYCISDQSLPDLLKHSFYYGAAYHFWYIYVLIGIYLFIPIIAVFATQAQSQKLIYFFVIWTIWLLNNMYFFRDFLPNINLIYFSGYLGYVVLGYYLHRTTFRPKLKVVLAFLLVSYVITFLGTAIASTENEQLETIFYQYLDVNVVIMTAATFMLFKYWVTQTTVWIATFSRYSFGIFFIHPIFIWFLNHYSVSFSNLWLVDALVKTCCVSLLSLAAIYLLNKLPKGKLYVG
ncbi:acyltransferase family protein [Flavobacterium agricola]|uniref:Acyltransferase family protein n=1 Tax=Flavobacterium agricola TaxID=2870839 RepID=A0ABY6M0H0_9FLAO|nr:acyltransferase family protein [Flavobacterium agricola]UYW00368.1 acyltransferase family protein [Flavobacterium agricola]